tara:strand:+ start:132 stop:743 length:612 start_codon:yes stop_codon:yes gene_type:complete
MKNYHDQHIGVYENAFSDEWCNKVINYFETNPEYRSPRNESFVTDEDGHLFDKNLRNEFSHYFNICYNLYTSKYKNIPSPLNIVGWKIQKTLPTEGFHDFHVEQGSLPPSASRVGVWTVYLNDVKEAGETEFLYQLIRVKPQKGTLCIFPAAYTHVHRGNTPFSGEKYIATGWLQLQETTSIPPTHPDLTEPLNILSHNNTEE